KFEELKLIEKGDLGNYKEAFSNSITLKKSRFLAMTRSLIGTHNPSTSKPIGYYRCLVVPKYRLIDQAVIAETFIENTIFLFLINYFPQILISDDQQEPIVFCQKDKDSSRKVRAIVFPPNCKEFYF
ncbi:hypothetical protein MUP35_01790, partial [Patescibacteria group bacterium]|nr:hypothetical protein [Patescibacteria group bacterium]